jgi:hypothetical protein
MDSSPRDVSLNTQLGSYTKLMETIKSEHPISISISPEMAHIPVILLCLS